MKITLATLNPNGELVDKTSLEVTASENGSFLTDDVPIHLKSLGPRFVYVHYEPNLGNMTFSLRRRAMLGHEGFYGNIVDFDAYVPLKRLPAAFLFRAGEGVFVKVAIEQNRAEERGLVAGIDL